MKIATIFLAVLVLLAGATAVQASTITYTDQATASGSLGLTSFTKALVTITFIGDTANANVTGPGFISNKIGTATVDVSGVGTALFTDVMFAFDNQAFGPPAAAGIADTTKLDASVLDTFNTAFATYDLASAIGPVSGAPFFNSLISFNTTLGGLNLTSVGDSTFTATIAAPEPGTLGLLMGGGLAALWAKRRKKLV